MTPSIRGKLAQSKRRIDRRLDKTDLRGCSQPMMTAGNIHYEIAERGRGIASGGIGLMHITSAPKKLTQGGSKAGCVLDAGMLEVAPDMVR